MKPLHIEGMGIIGSLLGRTLAARRIVFTWSDTDVPVQAWRATTGIVYDSPLPVDHKNYVRWIANEWDLPTSMIEQCGYWYLSKHPPHGNRWKPTEVRGHLKRAPEPSVHVNGQLLVLEARERFAGQRTPAPPDGSQVIVAHGFSERAGAYLWGWSRRVILHHDLPEPHPCLYLRKGRFLIFYAYPVPNTNEWYAGTHLIWQQNPKSLAMEDKYKRWLAHVEQETGFKVSPVGMLIEGWRPMPAEPSSPLVKRLANGSLAIQPLWHSGIRHAPTMIDAICKVALETVA